MDHGNSWKTFLEEDGKVWLVHAVGNRNVTSKCKQRDRRKACVLVEALNSECDTNCNKKEIDLE